jgi:AraC-like DNA-binding protein
LSITGRRHDGAMPTTPTFVAEADLHLQGRYLWVIGSRQSLTATPDSPGWGDRPGPGLGLHVIDHGSIAIADSTGAMQIHGPGTVYQRHRGQRQHWTIATAPYVDRYLYLNQAGTDALAELGVVDLSWDVLDAPADPAFNRALNALLAALVDRAKPRPVPRDDAALILALVQLFVHLAGQRRRSSVTADPWDGIISEAHDLLAEDPRQPLTIPAVAQQLGVPYHAFRRQFLSRTGCSPLAYRLRQRLTLACHLLRDRSVQDVAADLGYADAFAFSKQFRRLMGSPPSAWSKAHREPGSIA